jgi:alkylated DNA repair dioxygenase AlkB
MAENSETSEKPEELQKTQEETPKKTEELSKTPEKAEEEVVSQEAPAAPKARGRPRGSRDAAPRVKRVPVVSARSPEEEGEAKPVPRKAVKQVRVQEEQEEPEEQEAPMPDPPPPSPRTLRKERLQAHAAERRAVEQAKQARFDRVLDSFMGY